eukprot:g3056.t1
MSMCNNMLTYSHARIFAEQAGWGFAAGVYVPKEYVAVPREQYLKEGKRLGFKTALTWPAYFPALKMAFPPTVRSSNPIVMYDSDQWDKTFMPPMPCKTVQQPISRVVSQCQLNESALDGGCGFVRTKYNYDWGVDRLVPFKKTIKRWFIPKVPAHLPLPGLNDILIHVRSCGNPVHPKTKLYSYNGNGKAEPYDAAAMRKINGWCRFFKMTMPPVDFFDRVIADIKSRRQVDHIWVVSAPGNKKCDLVQYLAKKHGAKYFGRGKNGVEDWIFLRQATGPVIVTSGTYGVLAAWMSNASEVHQPLAGTNRGKVVWNEPRWLVHDVEDEKYFGSYSKELARFVFREGKSLWCIST